MPASKYALDLRAVAGTGNRPSIKDLQVVAPIGYSTLPSMTALRSISEPIARAILEEPLSRMRDLLSWRDGWDEDDALAPDRGAVKHAESWIVELCLQAVESGLYWIKPNVTASPDGEVVLEWWHENKKLTVYISGQSAEYVQVWGPDIDSMMSDGDAESAKVRESLWLWLIS